MSVIARISICIRMWMLLQESDSVSECECCCNTQEPASEYSQSRLAVRFLEKGLRAVIYLNVNVVARFSNRMWIVLQKSASASVSDCECCCKNQPQRNRPPLADVPLPSGLGSQLSPTPERPENQSRLSCCCENVSKISQQGYLQLLDLHGAPAKGLKNKMDVY